MHIPNPIGRTFESPVYLDIQVMQTVAIQLQPNNPSMAIRLTMQAVKNSLDMPSAWTGQRKHIEETALACQMPMTSKWPLVCSRHYKACHCYTWCLMSIADSLLCCKDCCTNTYVLTCQLPFLLSNAIAHMTIFVHSQSTGLHFINK